MLLSEKQVHRIALNEGVTWEEVRAIEAAVLEEQAPEGMVPKRIEKVESGFRGMFLKEAQAYKRGWNECRAAMLAAAEKL